MEKDRASEKTKAAVGCGLCLLLFLAVAALLIFGCWYYVKMGY